MTTAPARAIMAALSADQDGARFVGGAVRNALLGEPVTDVDIAARFPPDEVIRRLEAAGLRAVATGIEHGTVTAIADGAPTHHSLSHFALSSFRDFAQESRISRFR